ncbi:hypothetical protein BY996DRAFT_8045141 [Phakopsora pachyrhizi]|nr:hypothetical protein BY996DRAFT_8045141 [Phakopsora pachyrhizi]
MLFVSLRFYFLMAGYLLCSSLDNCYHYDTECFLFALPYPQMCCLENNLHYQMGFHLGLQFLLHQYVHPPL